jgi:crotonobetainyl-CoA:carnitine CoA-transferase CaiB-like acyl-CoA transferase
MAENPFKDVRVLDLSMFWAGATCGQILADLGMEVIKIESCSHPDPDRIVTQGLLYLHNELGDKPWNRGMLHLRRNRNKLGITLDLSSSEGRRIFFKLARISDIVVENFRRGVLERLGIDYPVLKEINPLIILVSLSSQGETGPEREYGSNAEILAFLSGLRSVSDYPDEVGLFTATNIPDPLAGTVAAGLALSALRYRSRTGRGLHIVLSQRELLTACIGDIIMDYSMNRRIPAPMGNTHPFYAPHGVYKCRGEDRWIAIAVRNEKEWLALCKLMGNPELSGNPDFATPLKRWLNRDKLDNIITNWTSLHDAKELMRTLQKNGVPASALFSPSELLRDEHLQKRGFWEKVNDPRPGFGTYICKGRSFGLSRMPMKTYRRAPDLGEHNYYVYKELLGLSDEEIRNLEEMGVIGEIPDPAVMERIPKNLPKKRSI